MEKHNLADGRGGLLACPVLPSPEEQIRVFDDDCCTILNNFGQVGYVCASATKMD